MCHLYPHSVNAILTQFATLSACSLIAINGIKAGPGSYPTKYNPPLHDEGDTELDFASSAHVESWSGVRGGEWCEWCDVCGVFDVIVDGEVQGDVEGEEEV